MNVSRIARRSRRQTRTSLDAVGASILAAHANSLPLDEETISTSCLSAEDRGQGRSYVVVIADHAASSAADDCQVPAEVQIVFA
ncbi:hypothetical protein ACVWY6_003723 [Williamsia sp. R60]